MVTTAFVQGWSGTHRRLASEAMATPSLVGGLGSIPVVPVWTLEPWSGPVLGGIRGGQGSITNCPDWNPVLTDRQLPQGLTQCPGELTFLSRWVVLVQGLAVTAVSTSSCEGP